MLYAFHQRQDWTKEPTAFWPAFWLAVVLVATKAFYLRWLAADPPSDLGTFMRGLAAISYSDVCYAAALGFSHRLALAIRRPCGLRAVGQLFFCLLYLLSAVYGVVNLVVFGFFLTPLTYPLLCLSGDLANFATSVAPFLSFSLLFAALASLFGLTQLAALSHAATSAASPRARRILRVMLLVLAVSLSAAGRHEFFASWNRRIDRRVAENAHTTFLVS